ncbi:hypothetical protein BsWGS_08027 [Bradybaena similaris]
MSSKEVELEKEDTNTQGNQDEGDKNLDALVENEEFDVEDDEESESDDDDNDDDGEESDGDDDEEGEDDETENVEEGVSEEDDNEDGDDAEDDEESEEGDDDDDEEDEDEDAEQGEEAENAEDSSSGDENCDRCPICLNRLRVQDIGTPESCDHSFCLECIQEWAKNVNTCPVDRQVFRIILARHAGEEKIFKQFPVENSHQENEEVEDDPTYCEVCGRSDREDRLLLCDRCDLGYHCDCLEPPLASVPVHEWFCPDCQQSRITVDPEHHGSGRQIARTRVSERVRRLIAEARAERAERRRRIAEMIVAQEALEGAEATLEPSVSATTSTATVARKKKTTRKRRTSKKKTVRKRKKTTKKRKTKRKSTGKKTKTRKRKSKGKGKRKVKKRRLASSVSSTALARTAISRAVTSVKGRIADKLGLSKPPAGRSIPMQKLPPSGTRQEGPARSAADYGSSALSILGSKDELYLFADQEGEERQPVSQPAISAEALLSRSARSSHKPLSFSPVKKKIVVKEAASATTSTSAVSGGFDLLGSILQNQDLLHKGSKHVTINRDGSLSASNSGLLPRSSTQIRTTESTASVRPSSPEVRKSTESQNTSPSVSLTRESKSATSISHSKSQLPRSVSFSGTSVSSADTPDNLGTVHDDRLVTETTSLASVELQSKNLATVKDMNSGGSKSGVLSDMLDSDTKYSCLSMDISVDATQDSNAAELPTETEQCHLASVEVAKLDDSSENVYSSTASSGSADMENGIEFNFADVRKTEQEGKPLTSSESSSDGVDNIKSNNSPSVGSRGSDTVLNTNINDSPDQETVDVKSGVDLEADAIFSNNARLNAEEDAGNNSIGFSTPTSSQTSLRNFAAVSSDLNSVHDDSSVGIMKRNFDILVSTSSNLAGYESGEENDNIEGYIPNPPDREEGEASESDEDEVKEEGRQRAEDDQEEGEIVDEEERERDPERRNMCEGNDDSGGLDVNAIHIEEMEIGTFRKRSMSQNEDNNNEDNKRIRIDEGTTNGTETKQCTVEEKNEEVESDDDDDDDHFRKPGGRSSFMLSSLLSSLKAGNFDGASGDDKNRGMVEKKAEAERPTVEKFKAERQKSEPDKKMEEVTMKPVSILDFIGGASSKFGLQPEEIDNEIAKEVERPRAERPKVESKKSEPDKKVEEVTIKPLSLLDFISYASEKFGLQGDDRDNEIAEDVERPRLERQKSEPEKEEEQETISSISILDFIGDASAKKFGLQGDEKDQKRGAQDGGYHRGYSGYSGGNSFGHRDSRFNGDRRRNQWQRDRRTGDLETGHDSGDVQPRSFDRRRDSWQEEEKRLGSRDHRTSNQRSDSYEQKSTKSHHGRESEKGYRKRDSESSERVVRSRSRSGSRSPRRKGEKRKKDKYHEEKNKHDKTRKSRWNQETVELNEKEDGKQDVVTKPKKDDNDVSKVQANGYPTHTAPEARLVASEQYQSHQYPPGAAAYPYSRAPMHPMVRPSPHLPPHIQAQMHPHIPPPGLPFNNSASLGQPPYSQTHHGHSVQQVRPLHTGTQPHHQGFPASYYPHPTGVPPRVPPPPPHPYPHAMYPGNVHYPPQPGQSAAPLAHQAQASQPHSGYPRYPQPVAHSYTQPVPHAAYPPRPAVPGAVPATAYTAVTAAATPAAPVYPQQQPPSAPTPPAMPRYNYPAVTTKPEATVAHSVTSVKPESISAASAPAPPEAHKNPYKHAQKAKETVKESPVKDIKPARARYPVSPPPAAPIKGITTYDKVDSSILLNEVKKGFRQLVEDAVRSALKGAWSLKKITKEEYKDIFKKSVEKVCGSKETVVHQEKIQLLVNAYVSKTRKLRTASNN